MDNDGIPKKKNHLSRVYVSQLIRYAKACSKYQGPVVQSIVSLTSSLAVKMLTVLVSTLSNLQVCLLKKCE